MVQSTATKLYESGYNRALQEYILEWKRGSREDDVDNVLAVIQAYNTMVEHSIRKEVAIGDLKLRFDTQRAYLKGVDVDLTITEFRVVTMLIDQAGAFLTYRALYDSVHYAGFCAGMGVEGYKTNVRSLIKRVRRKFESIDPNYKMIENYCGFGYRWKSDNEMLCAAK